MDQISERTKKVRKSNPARSMVHLGFKIAFSFRGLRRLTPWPVALPLDSGGGIASRLPTIDSRYRDRHDSGL